jgi:D-alanyl-D-alanine carboxypeptidase (penicillin-binding protein 5/6)
MKKIAAQVLALVCFVMVLAVPAQAAGFALPEDVQLTAAAVYMVNLDTGITVYEQDADTPRSVASLTKMMTALLLMEMVPDLENTMITAESVLYVPPITNSNSSHADIRPGEQVSALNMLYAMMLPSANEAAEAVGYYLGNGNLNNFYALMNARAAELGCTNTNFTSTNGLVEMESGNYSTARDLALIANACWQYEIFRTVVGSTEHEMPASNKHSEAYTIRTTNAMMKTSSGSIYRSYIRGIKTGSTEAAGRNFVSVGTNANGESYLCVVLGCPYDAEPTTGYAYSFFDTAALYDWVFASFSVRPSLDTTTPITEIRVNYSTDLDTLRLYPASDLQTILPTSGDEALERTFNLPDSVDAPIKQGDVVGTITLTLSGEVLGTVDLVAGQDVSRNAVLYAIAQIQVFLGSLYFRVVVVLTVLFLLGYGGLTVYLHRKAKRRKRPGAPAQTPRRPATGSSTPPGGSTPPPPAQKLASADAEDDVFFLFDD